MGQSPKYEDDREFREEASSLWRIALAPLIWAAHFLLSYGATAVVCAKLGADPAAASALRAGIGVATVIAAALIIWIGWRSWRQWDFLDDYDYEHHRAVVEHRHEFLGHASFLLAVISLVGVIYVALPAVFVVGCS